MLNIKYFGMLVEITQKNQESYHLTESLSTLADIEKEILKQYPKLNQTTYNIAVNQNIVDKSHLVKNGDELAFLPPFAGG